MKSHALLPLRAFLGFTFCFAGLQKLANPGFFQAGNPGSIQAQLAGSVRISPIHALVSPLTHVAVALGIVIAVAELAIGVGTVLGLWQRIAAAGGVVLSLMLFLTVSFGASPYYTGADIVFAFAWTPLLLAGADPSWSLDAVLAARLRARRESDPGRPGNASRREIVLKGTATAAAAVGGLILGGAAAGLGRLAGGAKSGSSPTALSSPLASPTATGSGSGKQGGHPAGRAIGSANDVPVGGSASFKAPGTGDPALVVQPAAGKFLAFDAVCPHAGCTVGYDRSAKIFTCPCHGSQFNGTTGERIAGPAAHGLTPIPVTNANGDLYTT